MTKTGWTTSTTNNGSLSIYSSDFGSLKELMSTILKENAVQHIPQLWTVGYEEIQTKKTQKDPNKPMAKFVALLRRNPALTTTEFHERWHGYAPTFSSWPPVEDNVVLYTQFHSSPEWSEELAEIGLKMSTLDGIVDIYFDEFENLTTVFNTQYLKEMIPHEAVFLGRGGGLMLGVDSGVGAENHSS